MTTGTVLTQRASEGASCCACLALNVRHDSLMGTRTNSLDQWKACTCVLKFCTVTTLHTPAAITRAADVTADVLIHQLEELCPLMELGHCIRPEIAIASCRCRLRCEDTCRKSSEPSQKLSNRAKLTGLSGWAMQRRGWQLVEPALTKPLSNQTCKELEVTRACTPTIAAGP